MRRPSFVFYVLFLGLNYFLGTLWYLLLTALVSVGLAVAVKRFVFWKYLTLDPPTNAAVLITGTSTGIGRGFALRLARSGVTVIATVRRQEDVDNWKKQHPELVKVVKPIILDVSNEQSITAAVPIVKEILKTEQKQLHSVVNNAGIDEICPIELVSKGEFDRVMGTNLWGPIAVTKAFLPLLREYTPIGRAKVVFISTVGVYMPLAFNGIYSASKLALESIADALRVEVKAFGIDVMVIQPGGFEGAIFDKVIATYKTFAEGQANNPIYDFYKSRGDKLERILGSTFRKTLNPVSVLAEELYHGLFGRFTSYTIASSIDSAVAATLYWLLPESIMTKFVVLVDKLTFK
jgi:NAD(P)-dependent dehydrogenase (short-subunit alcohol dehydrogenase family)